MPDSVDAAAVRRWCAAGLDALRRHQAEIDALNVYPIPDGDTGTNLALTMAAAVDALVTLAGSAAASSGAAPAASARDETPGGVLRIVARGALLGARGNSGIILAQLFKGLAETLADAAVADGRLLARALDNAARTAYQAVAAPVEGTVLSVGAAAARAALIAAGDLPGGADAGWGGADAEAGGADAASAGPDVAVTRADAQALTLHASNPGGAGAVARAAAEAARVALARTPQQLPALARAGVVDAGGKGLVVLLEALVQTLTGDPPPSTCPGPVAPSPAGLAMEQEAGSDEYAYEVQYLLEASPAAVDDLRRTLGGLGDSLVIVGDASIWHIHVHVNDVGAAIEAGIEAGRPSRLTVTRFADQIAAIANQPVPEQPGPEQPGPEQPGPEQPVPEQPGLGETAPDTSNRNKTVREVPSPTGTATETTAPETTAPEAAGPGMAGPEAGPEGAHPEAGPGVAGPGAVSAGVGEPLDRHLPRPGAQPHDESPPDARPSAASPAGARSQERAVVVVCSGADLSELLAAEGATVVTGSPSTGEILDAIRSTGAGRVVVLPNDPNVLAVASAAAAEARVVGIRAGVVPTRSPVQALAAMAVRDALRRFEDDVIAMAEAAARCRSAEVTIASREALTIAGRCQPGDVLAIIDGEVNLIGQDLPDTACRLLDRMLTGGGELVTLITGQDAPARLGETLRAHVEGTWPFVEVQCYEGGQPHYPLLVGVE